MAIVLARFFPLVRTFAPFVAGMVQMDKKMFMKYNITGCMIWVASMLLTGHILYRTILYQFNYDITKHLEIVVLGIVALTLFFVLWKIIFRKKTSDTITDRDTVIDQKL
jgi:membrane-associated protein